LEIKLNLSGMPLSHRQTREQIKYLPLFLLRKFPDILNKNRLHIREGDETGLDLSG
jgi:hypothetical protein